MIKFLLLALLLVVASFMLIPSLNIKVRQKRLIRKFGLSEENPLAMLYTTNKYRDKLLENVYYQQGRDFAILSRSNRFYLIKYPNRKYKLCLYCAYNNLPKKISCKSILETKDFFWVPLEDKYLLKFLERSKFIVDNGHLTRMVA